MAIDNKPKQNEFGQLLAKDPYSCRAPNTLRLSSRCSKKLLTSI